MPDTTRRQSIYYFGNFRLDAETGELRDGPTKVKLQEQPFQILVMLLERPGEIVTREELRQKLWGPDTFVDFENGLNIAVRKLRAALQDDAEVPRYIETVPRRGYRFTAEVKTDEPASALPTVPLANAQEKQSLSTVPGSSRPGARKLGRGFVWTIAGLMILAAAWSLVTLRRRNQQSANPAPIHSIAVLPLQNLSGDPAQEYFADGMTEELITDLAQISSLHVISRTSSMLYKSSHKTLPEIGRELHADAVVEGAVLRDGNRVRVTAQIIHAPSDTHLWASSYEKDISDVLSVQRDVARDIAQEVRTKLSPQEKIALARYRHVNPEAYEAYLKGQYFAHQLTEEGLEKSIQYFRHAVALDSNYAPSYAGIAYYYLGQVGWALSSRDAMPQAEQAAARAIQLDDSLAEAHAELAVVQFWYHWDWGAAQREFQRATALSPNDALVHQIYGACLVWAGHPEKGIAEGKLALTLDPVSAETSRMLADDYYFAHRYDEAVTQLREALQLQPDYWFAHLSLGRVYLQTGDLQKASGELETAARMQPTIAEVLAALAYSQAKAGQRSAAETTLQQLQNYSKQGYVDPYDLAVVFTGMEEKDQAFQRLNQAYEERSFKLAWLKTDPFLNGLRADPRFASLLQKVGLPE